MTVPRQVSSIVAHVNPASSDTTLVIRVWTEPGDSLLRGRVINITSGDEWVGRGADRLLEAVENLLRQLEKTADV